MPDASGTIALTSDLSAYLPLAGGTLTGALNGTRATITSTVQVGGTVSSTITIGDAVGSAADSNLRLRTGSTKYAWLIASQNNVAGFEITPSTAVGGTTFSTPALTILPTGAATFSSSVTATTFEATDIESGVYANYFGPYSGGSSSILNFLYGSSGSVTWNNGGVKMTLTSGGSLGIGTSSPDGKLDVAAGTGANILIAADATNLVSINNYSSASGFQDLKITGANQLFFTGTAGGGSVTERMRITSGGNVGIGTTSPKGMLQVGSVDANSDGQIVVAKRSGASNRKFRLGLDANYDLSIGDFENNLGDTYVPYLTIGFSTGAATFSNLAGAGSRAVNADASGTLSAASDSRLKQEVLDYKVEGLAEILKMQPRAYKWLSDIENRGENAATEIGFFANEVASIIPSAAPMGNDGYYGFYDRAVIAALVNSVKELNARIIQLENK
jgi:hypothetical protein